MTTALAVLRCFCFPVMINGTGSKNCAPCKGGDFQWVQFPPGDGSLQPLAIEEGEVRDIPTATRAKLAIDRRTEST